MPRANRYFQKGFVYHITHRCTYRKFLLRNNKDKTVYRTWLFKAVSRYKLSVLNYIITDNHIHLLVYDTGSDVIPNSIRYVASRFAFQYNRRRNLGSGSVWQGRYFATAIQVESYLLQCMIYIDFNMVRCGVVSHPAEWLFGGYNEILKPRKRYCIIDLNTLLSLTGYSSHQQFVEYYSDLINKSLTQRAYLNRQSQWTELKAIGNADFISLFE